MVNKLIYFTIFSNGKISHRRIERFINITLITDHVHFFCKQNHDFLSLVMGYRPDLKFWIYVFKLLFFKCPNVDLSIE